MNDPRLLELERELRRRRRAEKKIKRRRRRRIARASALGGTILLVVALTVAGGLAALGLRRGGAKDGARVEASLAPRRPVQTATRPRPPRPTRSPSGLALGQPPLRLDLSGNGDTVRVSFHHPPRAGLLFDLSTGRVLWQFDPLARLPIASLNKMMTALRVVRSSDPHERVRITREAVAAAGSKVGVLPRGKRAPLLTLLYGLLLPSGNDAAVALAAHVAGSVGAFVRGMNREAARLGLGCTHYSSPSGYFNIHNYSCAADLAELAHVDLEQPLIARIAGAARAVMPLPIKGGKVYLYNNNPLLVYGYPGATGLKTGYTESAGNCLVGTAERDGVRLGVVLLHSPELGRQAEHLLDEGFAAYGVPTQTAPPVPSGR